VAKHLIASQRTEKAAGIGLFILGAVLLRDAYDNRGQDVPWWARPFTFW
jgi:hypothetical protein